MKWVQFQVEQYAKSHGLTCQNKAYHSDEPLRIEGVARSQTVSFGKQDLKVTMIQNDKHIVGLLNVNYKENQKVVLENKTGAQQRRESERKVEQDLNKLKYMYSRVRGKTHREFETNKAQKVRGEIQSIYEIEGRKFAFVEHSRNKSDFSVVELKTAREKSYEVGQNQTFENSVAQERSRGLSR